MKVDTSQAALRLSMALSCAAFGTLGIFVQYLPGVPSAAIVMFRAIIGALFVGGMMLFTRRTPGKAAVRRNLPLLLCSGAALASNWTCLFEAYRHTTVAVASLCYYMAPVFLMLLSPVVLKEPMTKRKAACIVIAVIGAVLVSGSAAGGSLRGVVMGLLAAVFYCSVMLMNKKLSGLSPMETTLIQLGVAAIVITPYVFLTGQFTGVTAGALPLLIVLGAIHTGLAFTLFFAAVNGLPAQTTAVMSYIDPIVAILLSALFLHQPLSGPQVLGAILLLGGTFVSEFKQGGT